MCDNFPRQFHFFLGTFHEKHKFKYFKNLTVKVCKVWCNDVYMSILQCDIFWWKLIDLIFLNQILIPGWYTYISAHLPFFLISTVLHVIIFEQDIHICYIFHNYSTITLPFNQKYMCISITSFRN